MNHLANGAIAVGTEGSLMRLAASYEHELMKEHAKGNLAYPAEDIPPVVKRMLVAAARGGANVGPAFKRAAKACGINPTISGIKQYLAGQPLDSL